MFYIQGGNVYSVSLESRQPKQLPVNAEMDVDFSREKVEVFQHVWTYIRDQFFDPKFNGIDWNTVRARYEPLIAGSTTPDEMRRLLTLMLGELNASHWLRQRQATRRQRQAGVALRPRCLRKLRQAQDHRSDSALAGRCRGSQARRGLEAVDGVTALRENSEKWPIGGELSVLPFQEFSTPSIRPSANAVGQRGVPRAF